jgi:hypothetical protein
VPRQRRKTLNNRIIAGNLAEANEEIAKLLFKAVHSGLNEGELQVGLLHAYHHLNFAWNIRRTSTSDYAKLTDKQFERWGTYPTDIALDG